MMPDILRFLESLPPGPLYVAITVLAAVENIFPPVPADTAVALGAFLAGRGRMDPWVVFALTWSANVGAAAGVYALARRYGRAVFTGRLGVRLLSEHTLDRIAQEWARHGWYGIFLSRLLPVWRAVVCPFAGMGHLAAPRTLAAVALASGAYYGGLTFFVYTLGGNVEGVVAVVGRLNAVLAGVAVLVALGVAWGLWRARRARRTS
jgi:membrane protein DedA with SNARE-associated domain